MLDDTAVGDEGVGHLQGLNLNMLSLGETKVTDEGLKYLEGMSELDELYVWDNTGVGSAGMVHLKQLKNLQKLDIGGTMVGDQGLWYLTHLRKLGYINLSDTQVTGEGIDKLKVALPGIEVNLTD